MSSFKSYFKKPKYKNVKTERDGYSFPSKLEANVYDILKIREKSDELKIVRTQATVRLSDAKIIYMPDFECVNSETGEIFFVEAKGVETDVWLLKLRLYRVYGPAPLEIWIADKRTKNVFLREIVVPKRPKI